MLGIFKKKNKITQDENLTNFPQITTADQETIDLVKNYSLQPGDAESLFLENSINKSCLWNDTQKQYLLNAGEIGYLTLTGIRYKEFVDPSFTGASIGISLKVAKGVYLRQSLFRGKAPANTYYKGSVGTFFLTNKCLYFQSQNKQFSKKFTLQEIKSLEKGDTETTDNFTWQKFRILPDSNVKDSYYEIEHSSFSELEILINRLKQKDFSRHYTVSQQEYTTIKNILDFVENELKTLEFYLNNLSEENLNDYITHVVELDSLGLFEKYSQELEKSDNSFFSVFYTNVLDIFWQLYLNEIIEHLKAPTDKNLFVNLLNRTKEVAEQINNTMKGLEIK
jgi:hypothetical protein